MIRTLHKDNARLSRRDLLQGASYVALLMMLSPSAQATPGAAEIVAVRIWPAQDYTRVTIESDAALTVKHELLSDPTRLLVDIQGMELTANFKEIVAKVKADDPYIAQIRAAQFDTKTVRLVLDLKEKISPQLFTLKPVAAYQHRLVVDLYPAQPKDPLEKLISDLARNQTPSESNDPLGKIIEEKDKKNSTAETKPNTTTANASKSITPSKSKLPTEEQLEKIERLMIVTLDAGHGGEDPGATGPAGTFEKNITLIVAKLVKERIDALPNMRAVLTRDGDYFVPLAERVAKARKVKADLFVSLHADAFIEARARGASVFALSDTGASSTQARWLANKENAADLIGGINIKSKDKQVMRTLLDMSTTVQIRDSLKLGARILRALGRFQKLHKPHVEQAGFAVLKAPDIPSILIETAFISNPEEEQKLNDPAHQVKLANAIVEGINRYFAANPPVAKGRIG